MLDGFLRHREVQVNYAIFPRGGEDSELKGGEGLSCVTVGFLCKMVKGVLVCRDVAGAKPSFGIGQGSLEEEKEIGSRERFKLEDLGAGNQRGIDVEVRVVSSGADKANSALFEVRKEDVLLSLVEAVNLINEEESALVPQFGISASLFDLRSNFRDIGFDSVQGFETRTGRIGDYPGKGGLSGAGWAVKYERGEAVGLDGPAEKFSFSEDMLLSGDLGEGERAHAGGQRFLCAR